MGATYTSALENSTDVLKGCSYTDACTVGGIEGICVSKSSGCCTGTLSSGYCPGSNDVQCCTSPSCTTPQVYSYSPAIFYPSVFGETADISFLTNKCFILFVGKWYMCPDFQVL